MRYRWLALVVLTLVLMPRVGFAQSQTSQKAPAVKLRQNYPNPFNPETRGGFEVRGDPSCPDGGKVHRVTLRIYNILMQQVAVPVLQGGVGGVAGGQQLERAMLPCGQYEWYWNGHYHNNLSEKEASSGVYILIAEVDGQKGTPLKMTNHK